MMQQIKLEFFKDGPDNQKRPDIVLDLRRANGKKISKFGPMDKENMRKFIEDMENSFKLFKGELLTFCNA